MGTFPKFIVFILFSVAEIAKLCLSANSTFGCIKRERQALLRFKESVADPQRVLSSWEGNNCCQWKGIGCDAFNGHVVKLDLKLDSSFITYFTMRQLLDSSDYDKVYNLKANKLSPSLQELQYLNYLDLSGNDFGESPIPTFLGSMEHLRYLNLSNAYFGGKVPHEFGNLTKLHVLDLGGSTSLHTDDLGWAIQLSSLQHLDLSDVDLSKVQDLMKVLNMLPSLSRLILKYCELSNMHFKISDAFQNMTVLTSLDLSGNRLTSTPSLLFKLKNLVHLSLGGTSIRFFDAIQNMTFLEFLDLSLNEIDSISLGVGKLSKLVHLDLSYNKLGLIPNTLQNLTSIRFLDMSGNKLNLVPLWIGSLKTLFHLNLGNNGLHDPFPNAFENLTSIRSLIVYENNFASTIPQWLGNLKKLVLLDLTHNQFTEIEETLSSILTNSCEFKFLYLSNNNLQGETFGGRNNFSRCISYNLEVLDLAHNNFAGYLPIWLGHLKKLKYLLLDSNLFIGSIPPFLGELFKLRVLDLSNNHLNGIIPHSLGQLVNLQILLLPQNHLQGVIPTSLAQLQSLSAIDLSSNALGGIISNLATTFQRIKNLNYLDLSNNRISGLLPENINSMMPQLQRLQLANNLIYGLIPHSFCNWVTLSYLDISKNLLSGTIPDCWMNMDKYVINLSSNKLSGNIPSSLGNQLSLEMLHLNNNTLCGEIPISLKNCTKLIVLDLGKNQLSNVIPLWIDGNFSLLQILIIRENMFFGRIPSSLCQLPKLQVLDLASNHLDGPIPHCLGNLKGMTSILNDDVTIYWEDEEANQIVKGIDLDYTKNLKFLVNVDLSNNNLVGSIPNNLVALSKLVGLNLSHNHLFGEIPKNIGDMKSLESLDLCCNQLSGKIPKSMPILTFLSHLNLSYNNFSGMIPNENQFLTLNDPSSYTGNPYLCGNPLPECPMDFKAPKSDGYEDQDKGGEEDKYEKVLFYSVIAIGFAMGFWGFIGLLILRRRWRQSYFRFLDNITDRMYVTAVVRAAKLKKWIQGKLPHE